MIDSRTVFVLGAGASKPFGFPLGGELYRMVLQDFQKNQPGRIHLLNTTAYSERDVDLFIRALQYSGLISVDAFLEKRPEFLDTGKAAMAIELIVRENHDALWDDSGNWMKYLYGRMMTNTLEEFGYNNVAFVTFNYDRSLEHFLSVSLCNTFGKKLDESADLLRENLPIIHLHGRLGYLKWENTKHGRNYGDHDITVQTIQNCIKEMRVVHEDITDRDKDFSDAKRLLKDAYHIYFLGFGYGPTNVGRLDLKAGTGLGKTGTAIGLTTLEQTAVRQQFENTINLLDFDCLQLLREAAPL